eukprot:356877-Chlamydomonas_euryale.AAC.5
MGPQQSRPRPLADALHRKCPVTGSAHRIWDSQTRKHQRSSLSRPAERLELVQEPPLQHCVCRATLATSRTAERKPPTTGSAAHISAGRSHWLTPVVAL